MKPRELDGEQWEQLLVDKAEFQLFDATDQPIEGFTSTDPMNEPFSAWDDEDERTYELWPDPEGQYCWSEWAGLVAYWSVAA